MCALDTFIPSSAHIYTHLYHVHIHAIYTYTHISHLYTHTHVYKYTHVHMCGVHTGSRAKALQTSWRNALRGLLQSTGLGMCVAVSCNVLQYVAESCSAVQYEACWKAQAWVCVLQCVVVCAYICRVWLYTNIYIYIYICIHIHVYIYMYIYI